MTMKLFPAAVAAAIVPQAAHAAEIVGMRGGWEVFRDSKGCGMTMSYDGPGTTEMMVLKYANGEIRVMITNTGWSARQGRLYDVSYSLNGTAYTGDKAVGTADEVRKGFVSTVAADFAEDLKRGTTLHVMLAGREIERLPLNGAGPAIDLVDQCLVGVRSTMAAAEREKMRRERLPRDPFASPPRAPRRVSN